MPVCSITGDKSSGADARPPHLNAIFHMQKYTASANDRALVPADTIMLHYCFGTASLASGALGTGRSPICAGRVVL